MKLSQKEIEIVFGALDKEQAKLDETILACENPQLVREYQQALASVREKCRMQFGKKKDSRTPLK